MRFSHILSVGTNAHAERITEIDKAKQIEQIKSGLCNDDKILICNCGLVGANKSPKRALLK